MPHLSSLRLIVITSILITFAAIAVNANWDSGFGFSLFTANDAAIAAGTPTPFPVYDVLTFTSDVPSPVEEGTVVQLSAVIKNSGTASGVGNVRFYYDTPHPANLISEQLNVTLDIDQQQQVTGNWNTVSFLGTRNIYVQVENLALGGGSISPNGDTERATGVSSAAINDFLVMKSTPPDVAIQAVVNVCYNSYCAPARTVTQAGFLRSSTSHPNGSAAVEGVRDGNNQFTWMQARLRSKIDADCQTVSNEHSAVGGLNTYILLRENASGPQNTYRIVINKSNYLEADTEWFSCRFGSCFGASSQACASNFDTIILEGTAAELSLDSVQLPEYPGVTYRRVNPRPFEAVHFKSRAYGVVASWDTANLFAISGLHINMWAEKTGTNHINVDNPILGFGNPSATNAGYDPGNPNPNIPIRSVMATNIDSVPRTITVGDIVSVERPAGMPNSSVGDAANLRTSIGSNATGGDPENIVSEPDRCVISQAQPPAGVGCGQKSVRPTAPGDASRSGNTSDAPQPFSSENAGQRVQGSGGRNPFSIVSVNGDTGLRTVTLQPGQSATILLKAQLTPDEMRPLPGEEPWPERTFFGLMQIGVQGEESEWVNMDVTISRVFSVNGTVTYGNAIPAATRYVSNVTLTGAGTPIIATTTGAPGSTAGQYSLAGVWDTAYTVTPTKTGGVNGITSFDAARIAAHVIGSIPLTGNQLLVADVTGNGQIQSFDAAKIAQFVAAGPNDSQTGTWKFAPVSRSYPSVTTNVNGEDYSALLMGEVSGNWANSGARPAERVESGKRKVESGGDGPERGIAVELPSLAASVDKEIIVPVNVQGIANKGVISYEFDLRYDASAMQPIAEAVDVADTASRGLSVVTNATEPGLMRVVVYGAFPIDENGVLLNLRFTAVGAVGAVSPLSFERIMFNEGESGVTITDGRVELSDQLTVDN